MFALYQRVDGLDGVALVTPTWWRTGGRTGGPSGFCWTDGLLWWFHSLLFYYYYSVTRGKCFIDVGGQCGDSSESKLASETESDTNTVYRRSQQGCQYCVYGSLWGSKSCVISGRVETAAHHQIKFPGLVSHQLVNRDFSGSVRNQSVETPVALIFTDTGWLHGWVSEWLPAVSAVSFLLQRYNGQTSVAVDVKVLFPPCVQKPLAASCSRYCASNKTIDTTAADQC